MDGSSGTAGFIKEEGQLMTSGRLPDSISALAQEVDSEHNWQTNAYWLKAAPLIRM